MYFDNKTILITGATSGIGKTLALQYAEAGNKVYACGRNESALKALQSDNITTLSFDMLDSEAMSAALETISDVTFDIVILNAGICEYIHMTDKNAFDADLFAKIINVNLIATGYCVEAFLPKIKNNGTLALMGSSATFLPFNGASAYGASKAGIDYLARSIAVELDDVNISLISPGFVETPLTEKNDFEMPMKISSETAADIIIKGLDKKQKHIHFPKKFTYILKLISLLPFSWWRMISKKFLENA